MCPHIQSHTVGHFHVLVSKRNILLFPYTEWRCDPKIEPPLCTNFSITGVWNQIPSLFALLLNVFDFVHYSSLTWFRTIEVEWKPIKSIPTQAWMKSVVFHSSFCLYFTSFFTSSCVFIASKYCVNVK